MELLFIELPSGFIKAAQLLLSLSILVFIHELGHFLAAKAFKIKVEKFYIFFDAGGKKLFSFKRGETEYGIGWLPIGGYVKISGMIDESMDKDQLNKPPQPWEFRSKPVWQRFIVMIGGIVMNVLLGILVYTMYIHHFEREYIPVEEVNKSGIYALPLGEEVGFQTGDKLVAVNGKDIKRYQDINNLRIFFGGTVTVERDGAEVEIDLPNDLFKQLSSGNRLVQLMHETVYVDSVMEGSFAHMAGLQSNDTIIALNNESIVNFPMLSKTLAASERSRGNVLTVIRDGQRVDLNDVFVSASGKIGFISGVERDGHYVRQRYTLGQSFHYGLKEAFTTVIVNAIGFSKIFSGDINPRESIQSPIGIARFFAPKWEWDRFWRLTAMISMVLAFMNFLPIPALDGGHIMFLAIEGVTGKPVSQAVLERAQVFGMILILALMAFAFGNDILKLFNI